MTPSRALWISGDMVLTFCPGLQVSEEDDTQEIEEIERQRMTGTRAGRAAL